jgi:hypothetical protein
VLFHELGAAAQACRPSLIIEAAMRKNLMYVIRFSIRQFFGGLGRLAAQSTGRIKDIQSINFIGA